MNKKIALFQEWINARTIREQILLLLVSMAILYFFWNLIVLRPLSNEEQQLGIEIKKIQEEMAQNQNQLNTIMQAVTNPAYKRQFNEQKKLYQQAQVLKAKLITITPTLLTPTQLSKVLKVILSPHDGIGIINLKKLPVEPLIPKEFETTDFPLTFKLIYKYGFQLEFHSQFFKTIAFLKQLEQLPWRLYWDSLEYQVTKYPEGDVILKFHILSYQRGEMA